MTGPDESGYTADPMDDPEYRAMVELARNVPPIDWGDVPQTEAERPAGPALRAVGEDERVPLPYRTTDLGPYLDGTYEPETPNVGASRDDGIQMLYPGRWHTVIGPTEAGKSWLGLVHAHAVLLAGGLVAYMHFEETNPWGTVTRLLQLGIDREVIRERFVWVDCSSFWMRGEFELRTLRELPDRPQLVVMDGINAACTLQGWDVEKPAGTGAYRREFVTPSTAAGAAVLSLGHPVKSQERARERHGFGSTAWLDEVDGAGLRLIPASQRIHRGGVGYANLYVVKDRYGELQRHTLYNPDSPEGWRDLAVLKVDDTGDQTQVWLNQPRRERPPQDVLEAVPEIEGVNDSLSDLARRIVGVIVNQPERSVGSMSALKALLHPRPTGGLTEAAVDELAGAGLLERFDGPRGSRGLRVSGEPPVPTNSFLEEVEQTEIHLFQPEDTDSEQNPRSEA